MMLKMTLKSALAVAVIASSASLFAAELTVSAAASLTNAFKDIAENFAAAHQEHEVRLKFAGSAELLQQIAKGAPVAVSASADQETMDTAQTQGLLNDSSRKEFGQNGLVVITPTYSTLALA